MVASELHCRSSQPCGDDGWSFALLLGLWENSSDVRYATSRVRSSPTASSSQNLGKATIATQVNKPARMTCRIALGLRNLWRNWFFRTCRFPHQADLHTWLHHENEADAIRLPRQALLDNHCWVNFAQPARKLHLASCAKSCAITLSVQQVPTKLIRWTLEFASVP